MLDDLRARLEEPGIHGVAGRITRAILAETGAANPMDMAAMDFNRAAERYYRETLRRRQLTEGVAACAETLRATVQSARGRGDRELLGTICDLTAGQDVERFLARTASDVVREATTDDALLAWIGFVLVNVAAAGSA